MWLDTCKKVPWILGMAFMTMGQNCPWAITLPPSLFSPCSAPGCWYLLERSLCIYPVFQLLLLPSKVHSNWDHLPLLASWVCVFRSHRTITNKETVKGAPTTPPRLSEERIDRIPISKSSPKRSIFAYFKCCYLRILFPVSLYLGADWDLLLWDTGIPSTAGTPKKVAWTITNVWEATKR